MRHSYTKNGLNDNWITPSCSHHCLPTPLDLAVQQTNDEVHPCRLKLTSLHSCRHICGGSF